MPQPPNGGSGGVLVEEGDGYDAAPVLAMAVVLDRS